MYFPKARGDLLRLEPARHFKEDGIHIQRHKTANSAGKCRGTCIVCRSKSA